MWKYSVENSNSSALQTHGDKRPLANGMILIGQSERVVYNPECVKSYSVVVVMVVRESVVWSVVLRFLGGNGGCVEGSEFITSSVDA